jgi:transposase
LRHLFADSVYNGRNLREALAQFGDWTIEIVTRATGVTGFHPAAPMGCRANLRLAQSKPPTGKGLRDLNHQRHNLDLARSMREQST